MWWCRWMGLQTSFELRFTEVRRGTGVPQCIMVSPHSSTALKMCHRQSHLTSGYSTRLLSSPLKLWSLQCRVPWIFQSNSFPPFLSPLLSRLSMISQHVMSSRPLPAAQSKGLGRVNMQSGPWKPEGWVPATAPLSLMGPLFTAFSVVFILLQLFSSLLLCSERDDLSTYFPGKIENIWWELPQFPPKLLQFSLDHHPNFPPSLSSWKKCSLPHGQVNPFTCLPPCWASLQRPWSLFFLCWWLVQCNNMGSNLFIQR